MSISIRNRLASPRLTRATLRRLVGGVCQAVGCGPEPPELSVVMTGDAQIAALNRRWRGIDAPTDVLAFAQEPFVPAPLACWGDIVISYDTAAVQARQQGHDLATEVCVLLVHGTLHLLGYDHESSHMGPKARQMRAQEGRILRLLQTASICPPHGSGG